MSKKNRSKLIKLIANPGAGDAKEEADTLKQVRDSLEKNGLVVDLVLVKPKEEATPVARRASKKGYKVIVAMGGDGTVEAVMRGMIGSKSRLGIIPAGTENNVAKSLGIPLDIEEACALIANGNTLKIDIGQLKTKKGKKFHFFEIATVGLSAAIYPDLNKVANGKLSHIKDSADIFFHQDTKPKVYLTFNDESKDKVETMLVMVTNTPVTGKGLEVSPQASMQDGLLDVAVYPEFNKIELLKYYASMMDGGYSGDKKVQHYQTRKLKIKTSPKLDVMADGITLGKGTVKIKVQPGALRVLTNAEKPSDLNAKDSVAEQLPTASNKDEQQHQQEEVAIKVG